MFNIADSAQNPYSNSRARQFCMFEVPEEKEMVGAADLTIVMEHCCLRVSDTSAAQPLQPDQ